MHFAKKKEGTKNQKSAKFPNIMAMDAPCIAKKYGNSGQVDITEGDGH